MRGKPPGITAKGQSMRVAMLYAWNMHHELKHDFDFLSQWVTPEGIRVGLCEEAARDTVVDFEKEGLFCDDAGRCVFKWTTLYDNLRNGRFKPDDPAGALRVFRSIMRKKFLNGEIKWPKKS
jgi:hypothetical protein